MATDYDAPRKTDEDSEDSIEELKTRRNDKNSGKVDEDEAEFNEQFYVDRVCKIIDKVRKLQRDTEKLEDLKGALLVIRTVDFG